MGNCYRRNTWCRGSIVSGINQPCGNLESIPGNYRFVWCANRRYLALGIFTKRANTPGVWVGLLLAAITAYFVGKTSLTPFAVSMVSFFSSFIFGYIASLFFPKANKNIKGLTIYTKKTKTMSEQMQGKAHEGS